MNHRPAVIYLISAPCWIIGKRSSTLFQPPTESSVSSHLPYISPLLNHRQAVIYLFSSSYWITGQQLYMYLISAPCYTIGKRSPTLFQPPAEPSASGNILYFSPLLNHRPAVIYLISAPCWTIGQRSSSALYASPGSHGLNVP